MRCNLHSLAAFLFSLSLALATHRHCASEARADVQPYRRQGVDFILAILKPSSADKRSDTAARGIQPQEIANFPGLFGPPLSL
jgi:hypothetical protein